MDGPMTSYQLHPWLHLILRAEKVYLDDGTHLGPL